MTSHGSHLKVIHWEFLALYVSWMFSDCELTMTFGAKVSAQGQFEIGDIILVPELLDPDVTDLAWLSMTWPQPRYLKGRKECKNDRKHRLLWIFSRSQHNSNPFKHINAILDWISQGRLYNQRSPQSSPLQIVKISTTFLPSGRSKANAVHGRGTVSAIFADFFGREPWHTLNSPKGHSYTVRSVDLGAPANSSCLDLGTCW